MKSSPAPAYPWLNTTLYAMVIFSTSYSIRFIIRGNYLQPLIGLLHLAVLGLIYLMNRGTLKVKKPVILASLALGFLLFFPLILGPTLNVSRTYRYRWPKAGISTMIPPPPSRYGLIYEDSEEIFSMSLYLVNREDYLNYIRDSQAQGFDRGTEEKEDTYTAFNDQGAELSLYIDESSDFMAIYVKKVPDG